MGLCFCRWAMRHYISTTSVTVKQIQPANAIMSVYSVSILLLLFLGTILSNVYNVHYCLVNKDIKSEKQIYLQVSC